jgi:hypothetical protein
MINLTREEAQQVLDALLWRAHANPAHNPYFINDAITSLRAKLSEPDAVPKWIYKTEVPSWLCNAIKKATAPPQREITDDEFVAEAKRRGFFGFETPKLWLWKNFVDGRPEYWAFDNPYPRNLDNYDPQTLGQPCGYAIFKPSRDGSNGRTEEQVLREISEVQERS